MKNILITGASGFIGTNFINRFSKNYNFYAVLKNSKKNQDWSKKNKSKNVKIIFFSNYLNLYNIIKKKEFDIFLNLATLYLKDYDFKKINNLIESNIIFPSLLTSVLNKKKIKKIINIGSMMQHYNNKKYNPQNFYSATKEAFYKINIFFKNIFINTKFYNLKLHDTYGNNDQRIKLIPSIKKCYKTNDKFILLSKNLALNILSVNDVCNAIKLIINKNIKEGEYMLSSKNFTNIYDLIEKFNNNNKKKIKFTINNKKIPNNIKFKIKKLPIWKQKNFIENDFSKILNEKN